MNDCFLITLGLEADAQSGSRAVRRIDLNATTQNGGPLLDAAQSETTPLRFPQVKPLWVKDNAVIEDLKSHSMVVLEQADDD